MQRRWIASLALVACGHRDEPAAAPAPASAPPPAVAKAPPDAAPPDAAPPDAAAPSFTYERVTFREGGISLELPVGIPHEITKWNPGGVLQQKGPDLEIMVRVGDGETAEMWQTLDWPEDQTHVTIGAQTRGTVCGADSLRAEVDFPDFMYPNDQLSPARHTSAVFFAQKKLRMGAHVQVDVAPGREHELAGAIDHVLGSIRCP